MQHLSTSRKRNCREQLGVPPAGSAVRLCIPSSGFPQVRHFHSSETLPGRGSIECLPGQWVREVALRIDTYFALRVENELKAAVQINPNGFPPAFTLLRVPSTGIMMINEKCFAPLHKALMQSGMNFCFFFFLLFFPFCCYCWKKEEKRRNSRWESNWLLVSCLAICTQSWVEAAWRAVQRTLHPAHCLLPAFSTLQRFSQPKFSISQWFVNH